MSVNITPNMQSYINWLKTEPRIIDVEVSTVTSFYSSMLPVSVTNPLLFAMTLQTSTQTGVANVIISDAYYNLTDWGTPTMDPRIVDQLEYVINNDHPTTFGFTLTDIVVYANPVTGQIHPLFGFTDVPFDVSTATSQLQNLVSAISTVCNTVVLYEYLSPDTLKYLDVNQAFYCYCYFGNDPFVTFMGGKDAIGVSITEQNYVNTASQQTLVDYIANRIKEYKAAK